MAFHSTWTPNFDCVLRSTTPGSLTLGSNTVAAWVNLDSVTAPNDDGEIIEINQSNGQPFGSAIVLTNGNFQWLQRPDAGAGGQIQYNEAAVINTWVHLALTYDGTTMRCYRDGAEIPGSAQTGMGARTTLWADVQVGPVLGNLQDAVFYTAALSAAEIQELYRARMPRRRNNLQYWLPLFSGTGANRLIDYGGRGLNFTASGTPTDETVAGPSVGWGGDDEEIVIPAAGQVELTTAGRTTSNATANLQKIVPLTASGSTLSNATAGLTQIRPLAASGSTVSNASAGLTLIKPMAAAGSTTSNALAALQNIKPVAAAGSTVSNASAGLSGGSAVGPVALSAAGSTVSSATANVSGGSIPISGGGGRYIPSNRRGALVYGARRRIRG